MTNDKQREWIRKELTEYIDRKKIFNVGASEMEYLVSWIMLLLNKTRKEERKRVMDIMLEKYGDDLPTYVTGKGWNYGEYLKD